MSSQLISSSQWLDAAKYRRTIYQLKDTSQIPDSQIEEILQRVLSFAPSSFNIQPVRISLVTGNKHKELWDVLIKEAEPILKTAGEQIWARMSGRFQAFRAAYGSIIFWECGETIKKAADTHKSAAQMFSEWSDHASGMHQILVWTALELEGLGANLQHMNSMPSVEAELQKFCCVPADYRLKAHLNFGDKAQEHPQVPQKLPFDRMIHLLK